MHNGTIAKNLIDCYVCAGSGFTGYCLGINCKSSVFKEKEMGRIMDAGFPPQWPKSRRKYSCYRLSFVESYFSPYLKICINISAVFCVFRFSFYTSQWLKFWKFCDSIYILCAIYHFNYLPKKGHKKGVVIVLSISSVDNFVWELICCKILMNSLFKYSI